MSSFYRALGGAGTATLTYMSVLMDNGSGYALTIQRTFAAASYEWTDAQAKSIADDMVEACVGYGGSVAVLGFLLHGGTSGGQDYPLVSSTAAKAFANTVFETETGTVDTNPLWTMDPNGDAFFNWYINNVLVPEGDYSVTDSSLPYLYDAVGDVISTLSAYPDDALAWAYDSGDPAHTEWLFTRSWADGYEAPTALLLQIQEATGGIHDASAAYDSAETAQIMEVTGRAMVGLTMGDAAISASMLSDEAGVTLATAVGGLSPYFADTLTHDYNGNCIPVDAPIWVLGEDGPVEVNAPTPNVSQGVYVQVLTLIAPNDDAWSVYKGAVNEYQGAVFAMMGAGGDPPMDAGTGLDNVGAFQAFVDAVPEALTEMGAISDAEADGKMVDIGAVVVQQAVSKGLTAATGGTAAPWANLAGTGAKMLIGECGDLWVNQRLDAAMQASVDASFDAKAAFESNLESMLASADSPWMDGEDPLVTGPASEISRVAQDYEEAKVNVGRLVDSDYAEAVYLSGLEG